MILKSLRTSITINIAFLLLLGMLLINFVMLIVTQEVLINAEIGKGRSLLAMLAKMAGKHQAVNESPLTDPEWTRSLDSTMRKAGIASFVIITPDARYIGEGPAYTPIEEMLQSAQLAAAQQVESITTYSSIRHVFLRQPGYILIGAPLRHDGGGVGAAILLSLEPLYGILRRTQHIFLIYITINTAMLTIFGVYRLNQVTVKPIQRLVTRAEEYRETEDAYFLIDKEDNEFSKLSKSLNSMLIRISGDKEKLQASVSSLEKANLELAKAQRELIRAEKLASVGRLSAGIAHEIGNPIGIIKGYLDLLKAPDLSAEDSDEFIRRTEAEVERINAIIRQLLDFARPADHVQTLVHIHPLLSELEEICHFQPLFTGLKFTLDLGAEKDQVRADGRQLRQVFLNLILNAADSFEGLDSPDENRIIIRTALNRKTTPENRAWMEIQFSDNGAGIPEEALEYIFDPFYTTKDPGRGTGLGLSVSFAIIEGFGGTIQASGNAMHGTTMCIRLPLVEEVEAATHPTEWKSSHDAIQ